MDIQPAFGLNDLLIYLIRDMAQAVAERPGESQAQRCARAEAAAQTVLAFQPRDAIEVILAGKCMMYHELIVDAVHTTVRGDQHASRSNIVAMDRAFGNNLTRLRRYRADQTEAAPEAQRSDAVAETDITDRLRRHQWSAETETQPEPANQDAGACAPLSGSMNQDQHPALAAAVSGLNRQARRALDRYSRKCNVAAPSSAARTLNSAAGTIRNEPPATPFVIPAV